MKRLLLLLALLTVIACCAFVILNPNIAQDYHEDFSDGEMFMPVNGTFDFRNFTLNADAKNFKAKIISNGHVQLVDDTGNITVNVIELDKMIPAKRDDVNSILYDELKKPSWTVDGVCVHQIDFRSYGPLYAAYQKNSTTNTIIYLSTPNEQETADLMNSLEFDGN